MSKQWLSGMSNQRVSSASREASATLLMAVGGGKSGRDKVNKRWGVAFLSRGGWNGVNQTQVLPYLKPHPRPASFIQDCSGYLEDSCHIHRADWGIAISSLKGDIQPHCTSTSQDLAVNLNWADTIQPPPMKCTGVVCVFCFQRSSLHNTFALTALHPNADPSKLAVNFWKLCHWTINQWCYYQLQR